MATAARTYNQDHVARKYALGHRRVSIYWTWSYPWETNRDVAELDNRFSTITEVRREFVCHTRQPLHGDAEAAQLLAGLFHDLSQVVVRPDQHNRRLQCTVGLCR